MKSYAIVGTGALGGFYGAKLQAAGLDVHFLVNSDYHQIKSSGLTIQSKDGDFELPVVQAYHHSSQMPACEVVVICLKTTNNHLLDAILSDLVKPDSIVLVLQNGLGNEAEIARILSTQANLINSQPIILGGLCFICCNKIGPGSIHHLDYGQIKLGGYTDDHQDINITGIMASIATDFRSAGIPISLCDNLLLARWQKLIWNIPYNGLSVVLNATTDQLMANPNTKALVMRLMKEVQLAAMADDCQIVDEFIQQMLDYTALMKPYRTSMKIDYDEGRPLEIQAMFENPLKVGQKLGLDLPSIEMLYQQLQFLDYRIRV